MKIIAFLLVLFAMSSSFAQTKSDVAELTPASFKAKVAKDPNHVVLDVRTPSEVKEGAIAGAQFIDFNAPDFSKKIEGLDKLKSYYVYCKGGGRSAKAVEMMKQSGFNHVYNLKGGYTAWVKEGYPTTKP